MVDGVELGSEQQHQSGDDSEETELREIGHEPGVAVAEYLTFEAGADGVRRDYYRCRIKTL